MPRYLTFAFLVVCVSATQAEDNVFAKVEPSKKTEANAVDQHPLLPVIEMATKHLRWADENVQEYSCLMIKRERVDGELTARQYLSVKVRERRFDDEGMLKTPLSIYAKFHKPSAMKGREVLYVENQRNGDLLARNGGPRMSNITLQLSPRGRLAMRDNLEPITEMGFRKLALRLIENMQADLEYEDVEVKFYDKASLAGRECRHIQVKHARQAEHFDYHLARIFIDKELRVPVYFASYEWPENEGDEPLLKQEYIFTKIQLNPGFTDEDFESTNEAYAFNEIDQERQARLTSN